MDMEHHVPVVVSCSDKYLWCLKPFSYLFNKYWGEDQRVIVHGYTRPQFKLPDNFTYISTDTFCYPKEKWVDGFLKFLDMDESGMRNVSHFVLLLEDYWLCRRVSSEALFDIVNFCMFNEPDTLRFDLTADRLYACGMRDYKMFETLDIIHAVGSQYEMSLQAGLWNKELFKEVLRKLPNNCHSAWDVELSGNGIVIEEGYKVYGCRQWPIRYTNGMNNASSDVNTDLLCEKDKNIVLGMIKGM